MTRPRILPVIMSGGSGTRLWPLSNDDRPKQFHVLDGEATLIQATATRLAGASYLEVLDPVVICNARHLELTREQLAAVGVTPSAIVVEPVGRNTAAVAAAAAMIGHEIDPEALVLLAPADHIMGRPEALAASIGRAADAARDRIVTFGIHAAEPSTAYGYIKRAEALAEGVFRIEEFLEKPPLAQAQAYVANGGYDWNAGLFLFAPSVMVDEANRHAPAVWGAVRQAFDRASRAGDVIHLEPVAFAQAPSISIDNAIMEKTGRGAVAPCDPGWSDIGSWSEIRRLLPKDDDGNAVAGGVAIDCRDSLVWSSGGVPVAVVGVTGLVVVSTPDGVLIIPADRDQDVRIAHAALMQAGTKA